MDKHRQAIADHRRAERLTSAKGNAAEQLSKVESSAMAMITHRDNVRSNLEAEGRLNAATIDAEVQTAVAGWKAQQAKLHEMIDAIEDTAMTGDGIPVRTELHRERSAAFNRLAVDDPKRIRLLVDAIGGRDQMLAEALATDPPESSRLVGPDLEGVRKAARSDEATTAHENAANIRNRVIAARATLAEVTEKIERGIS